MGTHTGLAGLLMPSVVQGEARRSSQADATPSRVPYLQACQCRTVDRRG